MTHSALQPPSLDITLPAPSPSVLDVFVVWHPEDKEGASICDTLFEHYHSDAFAGLAGSAVEVYGRSCALPGNNELPAPIVTVDGSHAGGDREPPSATGNGPQTPTQLSTPSSFHSLMSTSYAHLSTSPPNGENILAASQFYKTNATSQTATHWFSLYCLR